MIGIQHAFGLDLPSAIPQVEYEISHESNVAVFDVNCSAQAAHIFGDIVAEYDGPHGRFASSRSSHQQHLSLLLALAALSGRAHLSERNGDEAVQLHQRWEVN